MITNYCANISNEAYYYLNINVVEPMCGIVLFNMCRDIIRHADDIVAYRRLTIPQDNEVMRNYVKRNTI